MWFAQLWYAPNVFLCKCFSSAKTILVENIMQLRPYSDLSWQTNKQHNKKTKLDNCKKAKLYF